MAELQKRMAAFRKEHGNGTLSARTGLSESMLDEVLRGKHGKHRKNNLDILYSFFGLEPDAWYRANMKKWVKPTESVLGEMFRKKRLSMGMSLEDVRKATKIGTRQLARLEAGDSLPSFSSYTVTKLLELYDFDEGQRERIRWFVVVLRDIVSINNSLR